jgi:transcriptional regulator
MGDDKPDVLQGTLALLVLRTLDTLGPLHGYGIARRIEHVSGNTLALNQGTLYPALLRLEQMGWLAAKWGVSENNRKAKYYTITRAGQKQLAVEEKNWERVTALVGRFLDLSAETR